MTTTQTSRAATVEIEIAAPVEQVWRALTEPDEITRWFSLEAEVAPGEGGHVWYSWGGNWQMGGRVAIWEPNRRLRLLHTVDGPSDATGKTRPTPAGPVELGLEFHLESRGGRTIVRLVHDGFGRDADWDDEFTGVSRGWRFEMDVLRHYLTRHAGRPRHMAWVTRVVSRPASRVWTDLTGPGGLVETPLAGLSAGAPYSLRLATGDRFEGTVLVNDAPHEFAGTVAALDDALFRIDVHEVGGSSHVSFALETWGASEDEAKGFAARLEAKLPTN